MDPFGQSSNNQFIQAYLAISIVRCHYLKSSTILFIMDEFMRLNRLCGSPADSWYFICIELIDFKACRERI
jgi:hypothetical protein